jgi:thiamine-phosphate pyrophosphorylase
MTQRPKLDPTLYLVTDPELGHDRALGETVAQAVRGGVTLVQLRDKRAEGKALLEQARELRAVLEPLGVPLIVNDRVDVALASGAAGCHVGQTDLPAAEARAILGPEALLGLSLDQVEQARSADHRMLDYIAFGPFATTGTKSDAGAPVGADGVRTVRAQTTLPLVAIGGIDLRNAAAAIAAGADGIAVVRAIMAAADPEVAARELRQAIEMARRHVQGEQV